MDVFSSFIASINVAFFLVSFPIIFDKFKVLITVTSLILVVFLIVLFERGAFVRNRTAVDSFFFVGRYPSICP